MTLPDLVEGWLPPGHYETDWEEIERVFGGTHGTQRAKVWSNLVDWRDQVRQKGIAGLVILDGSFISAKENPGDFDCLLIYNAETKKH